MSMKFIVVFDTKDELIHQLKALLDSFLPSVSVDTVDTGLHRDYVVNVGAAPAVLETPAEAEDDEQGRLPPVLAESDVAAPTPSPLGIDEIIDQLTRAFHGGDKSMKDRLVEVRNSLGLKFLSDAKPEHAQVLHDLLVELRL